MAIQKVGLVLLGACVVCVGTTLLMAAPFRKPRYSRPSTPSRPTVAPSNKPAPSATAPKPAPSNTTPSTIPTPPQPKREPPAPMKKPAAPAATPKPEPSASGARPNPSAAKPSPSAITHPVVPAKPAPVQPRTTELVAPSTAAKPAAPVDPNKKYEFRYRFQAGETVRWEVEHLAKVATTVDGSSQTAETTTLSVKAWAVTAVAPDGQAVFVNAVDSVDMRQKHTGRQEVRYNSRTDAEAPPIFQEAARQVGIPLAEITIDARGNVVKRVDRRSAAKGAKPAAESSAAEITIVLPEEPLAVGESFATPFELSAIDSTGVKKIIKARRKLVLVGVSGDVAELTYDVQILSPLEDRAVESQVAQSEQTGKLRFDLARGRIVELSMSNDRQVFGFQGEASMMHVQSQMTERLIDIPRSAAQDSAERK